MNIRNVCENDARMIIRHIDLGPYSYQDGHHADQYCHEWNLFFQHLNRSRLETHLYHAEGIQKEFSIHEKQFVKGNMKSQPESSLFVNG